MRRGSSPILSEVRPSLELSGVSPKLSEVFSAESLARSRRKFQVSKFDPRIFFVFRNKGGAVGDIATHIDDIVGCGKPVALSRTREFSVFCPGAREAQEKSFAQGGAGLPQGNDVPAALTHGGVFEELETHSHFPGALDIPPTSAFIG